MNTCKRCANHYESNGSAEFCPQCCDELFPQPHPPGPLERGTQIIYVPTHANGDLSHPDCEPGFVTSAQPGWAYCRYWLKPDCRSLRTKANSERTPVCALVVKDTVPQEKVEQALEKYC